MLPAGSEGEALLRTVLADAVRVAARTEGAYDPTILPVVRLWDFDDGGRLPSPEALASAVSLVDYTTVRVTGALALAPGQQVDLGGVGKGAVVDLRRRRRSPGRAGHRAVPDRGGRRSAGRRPQAGRTPLAHLDTASAHSRGGAGDPGDRRSR